MNTNEIDPKAIKPFLKSLLLINKKFSKRDEAKANLHKHIKKVKLISGKGNKKEIAKELNILPDKIIKVTETEKELSTTLHTGGDIKGLKNRFSDLERQLDLERTDKEKMVANHKDEVLKLTESFKFLKSQLVKLIDEKKAREKRLEKIDKRIKSMTIHKSHL